MNNQHKKINRGRGKFIINIYNNQQEEKKVENKVEMLNKPIKLPWYRRLFLLIILFVFRGCPKITQIIYNFSFNIIIPVYVFFIDIF